MVNIAHSSVQFTLNYGVTNLALKTRNKDISFCGKGEGLEKKLKALGIEITEDGKARFKSNAELLEKSIRSETAEISHHRLNLIEKFGAKLSAANFVMGAFIMSIAKSGDIASRSGRYMMGLGAAGLIITKGRLNGWRRFVDHLETKRIERVKALYSHKPEELLKYAEKEVTRSKFKEKLKDTALSESVKLGVLSVFSPELIKDTIMMHDLLHMFTMGLAKVLLDLPEWRSSGNHISSLNIGVILDKIFPMPIRKIK